MNKFVLLAIILSVALAVQEIAIKHKQKTPAEAKRFLRYLRRDTYLRQAEEILSSIFPGKFLTEGMYSYPEVKIFNYLDTEYYGYASHLI